MSRRFIRAGKTLEHYGFFATPVIESPEAPIFSGRIPTHVVAEVGLLLEDDFRPERIPGPVVVSCSHWGRFCRDELSVHGLRRGSIAARTTAESGVWEELEHGVD